MPARILVLLVIANCGGDSQAERPLEFGGDRPATLKVPATLEHGKLYPLVLVLHGYSANGFVQAAYFTVNTLPMTGEAFMIAPDGLIDPENKQFWNADPACCDFYNTGVDDVGYIGKLVEDVMASWPIDPDQVFVVGHSNGAFMAYRMACERPDLFAAVVALAGNTSLPQPSCTPSRTISMLLLHGTADLVVPYDGSPTDASADGHVLVPTAGAIESNRRWSVYNGCTGTHTSAALDLDSTLDGAETTVEVATGCSAGVGVELWSMEGAGHLPVFGPSFHSTLMTWFTDHRRQ